MYNQVLITGGAGFIGLNFLLYCLKKYPTSHYVCLDSLTYAANVKEIEQLVAERKITFVRGSICDYSLLTELFQQYHFDCVINFAAETHVDRSIADSYAFYQTNVMGVWNLLEVCKQYGIKRYHQISTDEVYGDLPLEDDRCLKEYARLNPSNPYSASKAAADLMILSYFKTYQIPITISRSSNNYGPYQHMEKFIPTVICRALNDLYVPIYGNGKNMRDWIYVTDHCKAIDLIIHKGTPGEIYNISTEQQSDNIFIAKKILSDLNKPITLIKYVDDRPGHDLKYSVSNEKIKNTLGWTVDIDLEDGLKRTIQYYKNCIRSQKE